MTYNEEDIIVEGVDEGFLFNFYAVFGRHYPLVSAYTTFERNGYIYLVYVKGDTNIYYKRATSVIGLTTATENILIELPETWAILWGPMMSLVYQENNDRVLMAFNSEDSLLVNKIYYAPCSFDGDLLVSDFVDGVITLEFAGRINMITIHDTGSNIVIMGLDSTNAMWVSDDPDPLEGANWIGYEGEFVDNVVHATNGAIEWINNTTGYLIYQEAPGGAGDQWTFWWRKYETTGIGGPNDTGFFSSPLMGNVQAAIAWGNPYLEDGIINFPYFNEIDENLTMVSFDTSTETMSFSVIDDNLQADWGANRYHRQLRTMLVGGVRVMVAGYDRSNEDGFYSVYHTSDGISWNKTINTMSLDYDSSTALSVNTPAESTSFYIITEVLGDTPNGNGVYLADDYSGYIFSPTIDFTGTPIRGDAPLLVQFTSIIAGVV